MSTIYKGDHSEAPILFLRSFIIIIIIFFFRPSLILFLGAESKWVESKRGLWQIITIIGNYSTKAYVLKNF